MRGTCVLQAAAGKPSITTLLKGTRFENRTHAVLKNQMSMSLTRIGGRADGGIDLQGDWWLPPLPSSTSAAVASRTPVATLPTGWSEDPVRRRLRVYVQCKAEAPKLGPHFVREMEGVVLSLHRQGVVGAPALPPSSNTNDGENCEIVAVLASESSFTRGGIDRARQSQVPFVLLHLPPLPDEDAPLHDSVRSGQKDSPSDPNVIGGCMFNPALVRLLGSEFEVRWERPTSLGKLGDAAGRPVLWWNRTRLRNWTPEVLDPNYVRPQ
ncbi:hypothetical protein BKA62DRAFT_699320 [Auriculariales sp. MPI-PUGE-AT-0066]|nr:hypothetical protein BKA62DRAFT_699320 [Auriculariales sp. MPI-PUGE-AT-0066]